MDTSKALIFPCELYRNADEKTNRRKNFAHARGLDLESKTCQNIDAYNAAKKEGFVPFLDVFSEKTEIVEQKESSVEFPPVRRMGRPRK